MKTRKREKTPKIRMWNDPVLKKVCYLVGPDEETGTLIRGMCQALKRTKNGVGLAAPQLGILSRVIVVMKRDGFFLPMINPVITAHSQETQIRHEGCLSYPGKTVPVERYYKIELIYQNQQQETVEMEVKGRTAQIIQHELDHLDGICKVGSGKPGVIQQLEKIENSS